MKLSGWIFCLEKDSTSKWMSKKEMVSSTSDRMQSYWSLSWSTCREDTSLRQLQEEGAKSLKATNFCTDQNQQQQWNRIAMFMWPVNFVWENFRFINWRELGGMSLLPWTLQCSIVSNLHLSLSASPHSLFPPYKSPQ